VVRETLKRQTFKKRQRGLEQVHACPYGTRKPWGMGVGVFRGIWSAERLELFKFTLFIKTAVSEVRTSTNVAQSLPVDRSTLQNRCVAEEVR
jgi:hypothetical protein